MDCIAFTGGGTGGHIFPGIAVAELLIEQGYSLFWIGASKGTDRSLIEAHNIEFKGIPAGKLRRYFSIHNFFDIFRIIAGFFVSVYILKKYEPRILFSKGGFVSVPPCIAAAVLGIPVITHECDFSPGLATKLNARVAQQVLVSYPETLTFFSETERERVIVTGNPVRRVFYKANAENGMRFVQNTTNKPMLLVLGGSLGAQQINEMILEAIDFLCSHFYVVHQVGNANIDFGKSIQEYLQNNLPHHVDSYCMLPFIKAEMADVLAAASIVVSRAGANSLWEATATGKPLILVPLEKGSSRGDQIENAQVFKDAGAAIVLSGELVADTPAAASNLRAVLQDFLDSPEKLQTMAEHSKNMAQENPAKKIAELLEAALNKGV